LGLRPRKPRADTLLDTRSLELGDRAENAGNEAPGGGRCVDPLTKGHKRDSSGLPVVKKQYQVAQISTEAIKSPAHDGIELMPPHVDGELIQGWPTILGTADAVVDVFDGAPSSRVYVASEFKELIFCCLVSRADACVNADSRRGLHAPSSTKIGAGTLTADRRPAYSGCGSGSLARANALAIRLPWNLPEKRLAIRTDSNVCLPGHPPVAAPLAFQLRNLDCVRHRWRIVAYL